MKIFKEAILLSLLAIGLGACSEDNPWAGGRGKGGIDLKLSASADVEDAIPVVRSGAPELEAPDVADFAVELRNLDTDQNRTWQSLDEFHNEGGFDVGSYTLTAFYGNESECGFDKPYFKGEATVNVLEGRESSVSVTAQLANVMLSIEYTDAFRNYFRDYSVTAHTDGHANVVFGKSETRAGFLAPGDVTLQMSLTNPSGKTATITPAQFPAQARHHYHVKFDVNSDPMGNATLAVVFDDTLTKENVYFSLSDELYNADAPIVHTEGFTSGQAFEALAGNSSPSPLKFETICKGGIKSAILKIAQVSGRESYNPSFGNELDLVQADEATQYQIEQNGIKVAGIFKNPQQMAIVDLTDLPRYLPEGTFEVTLTVTDMVGRNNETPAVLNLSTLPISLSVTGGSAVYEYPGSNVTTKPTVDATVLVNYNGLNPEQCISFKNLCRTGIYKDCDIVEVKESTATRGFTDKSYIFNIKVCDVENSPLPMQIWFNGVKYGDFELEIIEPDYSLEADTYATYSRFRVVTDNAEDIPTIVNGMTLYKDGSPVDKSLVTTDPEKGLMTMSGLDPDKDYTIGYSLTKRVNGIPESKTIKIHTEAATQISNGDFSQTENLIVNNLQVGGQYRTSAAGIYTNHASINRAIPLGWATINAKTCKADAKNLNTWFVVPSTYVENGRAIVRNVGYSHNGATPAQTGNLANTTYYNTNGASFADSEKVSGELFLGSYSFTTQENRSEGVTFGSRPKSLSFEYSYDALSGDEAWVEIEILDANGAVISSSSNTLDADPSMSKVTLKLPAYEFGTKAGGIKLKFKSSTRMVAPINIPSGNALDDGAPSRGYTFPDANHYNAVATGSVLTIDNIKLNY
ncbi:MAG: DUF4493 domain-containing protein [Muribaculaceae bacterium]|nr:DUF4493 domain-containing protein [Muribaculaceae bacterium]